MLSLAYVPAKEASRFTVGLRVQLNPIQRFALKSEYAQAIYKIPQTYYYTRPMRTDGMDNSRDDAEHLNAM